MSDFSSLEQNFAIPAMPPMQEVPDLAPSTSTELQPEEVGFIRLRGHREIARVQHLRQQIALPTSAVDDPGFASREKKETRWVS